MADWGVRGWRGVLREGRGGAHGGGKRECGPVALHVPASGHSSQPGTQHSVLVGCE